MSLTVSVVTAGTTLEDRMGRSSEAGAEVGEVAAVVLVRCSELGIEAPVTSKTEERCERSPLRTKHGGDLPEPSLGSYCNQDKYGKDVVDEAGGMSLTLSVVTAGTTLEGRMERSSEAGVEVEEVAAVVLARCSELGIEALITSKTEERCGRSPLRTKRGGDLPEPSARSYCNQDKYDKR
ncbi:hypothetical protein COP2_009553 [Malus domestica]